jgi:hypothetical protein
MDRLWKVKREFLYGIGEFGVGKGGWCKVILEMNLERRDCECLEEKAGDGVEWFVPSRNPERTREGSQSDREETCCRR